MSKMGDGRVMTVLPVVLLSLWGGMLNPARLSRIEEGSRWRKVAQLSSGDPTRRNWSGSPHELCSCLIASGPGKRVARSDVKGSSHIKPSVPGVHRRVGGSKEYAGAAMMRRDGVHNLGSFVGDTMGSGSTDARMSGGISKASMREI